MYKSCLKRLIDIALSATGLAILALPMLIIAVIVKMDSKGPVLFWQKRIGLHKKTFMMPKFRTNWFCGIRNPWTISSETVWRRAQRVGGRMFFVSGLIAMAGAFAPNDYVQFAAIFIPILTSTAILTILSYRWYQQEQQ